MRVTCRPMLARSDGSGASSSRSITSRSAGTAQISLCITPLTSAHHAAAWAFAAARSLNGACGTIRSLLAYPTRFSTIPFDSGSFASQKSGRNP